MKFLVSRHRCTKVFRHAGLIAVAVSLAWATSLAVANQPSSGSTAMKKSAKESAKAFLDGYKKEYVPIAIRKQKASWKSETTGKAEYFAEEAKEELAMRSYLSDRGRFEEAEALLKVKDQLDPVDARALEVIYKEYKSNQVPPELLKKMVGILSKTTEEFNNFRGSIDGKKHSDNELLEILDTSDDSEARRQAWEAMKQSGEHVSKMLIELVEVRNEAARAVGYKNYWEMQLDLQDFKPEELQSLFDELDELTRKPFMQMKAEMDAELAERFKVLTDELRPWHYNNPFFQDAQPNKKIDLNEFYNKKTKEDIVTIATKFYQDVAMPIESILARSDLYERPGKSQHAFCTSINRKEDVRTLCNIRPTASWMDTILHEEGHAVYDFWIDRSMPFAIRTPPQPFTTEGVAMYFGALAKSPEWMVKYADADPKRVDELREEILKQRRAEQLTFCRYTLVMFNFERELYANPRQDLNRLWWKMAAKYQDLHAPADRDKADWASKMHFHAASVYYHNYMLGELFAAQLRNAVQDKGIEGWTPELGRYMIDSVFHPGHLFRWPEFVEKATGEPLSAKAFAKEVSK